MTKFPKIIGTLALLLFAFAFKAGAQAVPTNPNGDPDAVPITGLEYLLISGGVLGGYKLLRKKINSNHQ